MTRKQNDELRATMGQLTRRSHELKENVIGLAFVLALAVVLYLTRGVWR